MSQCNTRNAKGNKTPTHQTSRTVQRLTSWTNAKEGAVALLCTQVCRPRRGDSSPQAVPPFLLVLSCFPPA